MKVVPVVRVAVQHLVTDETLKVVLAENLRVVERNAESEASCGASGREINCNLTAASDSVRTRYRLTTDSAAPEWMTGRQPEYDGIKAVANGVRRVPSVLKS